MQRSTAPRRAARLGYLPRDGLFCGCALDVYGAHCDGSEGAARVGPQEEAVADAHDALCERAGDDRAHAVHVVAAADEELGGLQRVARPVAELAQPEEKRLQHRQALPAHAAHLRSAHATRSNATRSNATRSNVMQRNRDRDRNADADATRQGKDTNATREQSRGGKLPQR